MAVSKSKGRLIVSLPQEIITMLRAEAQRQNVSVSDLVLFYVSDKLFDSES